MTKSESSHSDGARAQLDELLLAAAGSGKVLLIVEGARDREFYEWFLDDKLERVQVYTADDVEVSPHRIYELGLTMGNRSQLIYLSSVASRPGDLRLLIDRDCSRDIPEPPPPTLLLTDYPALESYAFTRKSLNKWLRLIAPELSVTAEELIHELRLSLFELFYARVKLPGMKDPNHSKYFSKDSDGKWSLDLNKLAIDYGLNPSDAVEINALAVGASGDPRHQVYGHDLAALLELRIKAVLKNKAHLKTTDAVERTIRMSMEHDDLSRESLFISLANWIDTTSVEV